MHHEHDVKTLLLRELPELLEHDLQIRERILQLVMPYVAPRDETENRIDQLSSTLETWRERFRKELSEHEEKLQTVYSQLRRLRVVSERRWAESAVASEHQLLSTRAEAKWENKRKT